MHDNERDAQDIEEYVGAPQEARGDWLVPAATAFLVICAWPGAFALWMWSCYLIYHHWGIFLALVAITVFPFAAVVVFTCFFWGVWYYILGVAAVITSLLGLSTLEDSTHAKVYAVISPALVLALAGAFAYFAWQDIITPDPVTRTVQKELREHATQVVTLLRASNESDSDPELAVELNKAIRELRDEIQDYDALRMNELIRMVNDFLIYERALEKDLVRYLENLAPGEPWSSNLVTTASSP